MCVVVVVCGEQTESETGVCVEQNNKNGIFGETQQNKHTLNKCINQSFDISRTSGDKQVRSSTSVTCIYIDLLQQ